MNYFFFIVVGLILGLILGVPAIILARKFGFIDIPGSAAHKLHKTPTPLAGGILIIFSILIFVLFFNQWLNHDFIVVLIGAGVIFVFGIWDDKVGLSAKPKLLGQFVGAVILISQGVQVHLVDALYRAGYVNWYFAQAANIFISFFWLIGITNAVNMIDSMDGIVAGMGVVISICYLYAAYVADQTVLLAWSGLLIGICASLYFWNKIKGMMFLGDSGSQIIGFLFAAMGILYNPSGLHPGSLWFFPIMILGVPIFDTTLVVFSRLKRKQSIGTGRQDHTYHRLIALGYSRNSAVYITHLVALFISGLGFLSYFLSPVVSLSMFIGLLVFGTLILIWFEKTPTLDNFK